MRRFLLTVLLWAVVMTQVSVQAQESPETTPDPLALQESTAEPTPTETPSPISPTEVVPTLSPTTTSEPTATSDLPIIPEPTTEVPTDEPAVTPTVSSPTPDSTPVDEIPSALPLQFTTHFDDLSSIYPLILSPNWTPIATDTGIAIQSDLAGSSIQTVVPFARVAIEAELWISHGAITLYTHRSEGQHGYSLVYDAAALALYRNDTLLGSVATPVIDGWHSVRFQVEAGALAVSINDAVILTSYDADSLPIGYVGLDSRPESLIRIGAFRLYSDTLLPPAPITAPRSVATESVSPIVIAPLNSGSLAPAAPTLVLPIANAVAGAAITLPLSVSNVVFDWAMPNTVGAPFTYLFELSSSSGFNTISEIEPRSLMPGEALNLDVPPLPDGNYFWRVKAINNLGVAGPWSAARRLTLDRLPPPAVPLNQPAAMPAVSTNSRPSFSWASVAGAVRYRLIVSLSYDLNPPLEGFADRIVTGTTFTGSGVLGHPNYIAPLNGEFFWGVAAIDAAGNEGVPEIRASMTDIRLRPLPDQLIITPPAGFLPRLEWTAVAGANTYTLEIANNADFSNPQIHVISPNSYLMTRFDIAALYPAMGDRLMSGALIYWRVTVTGQTNGYLPIRQFFTVDRALSAPGIGAPVNAASLNDTTPAFLLTQPLLSLVSNRIDAEIQLSTSSAFTPAQTVSHSAIFTGDAFEWPDSLSNTPGTVYYWRARYLYQTAIREIASPFTPTQTFRLDTVAPSAFALLSPIADAQVVSLRPPLRWAPSSGAVRYDVHYTKVSDGSTIVQSGLTSPAFTPLLTQGFYEWKVVAMDAAGNTTESLASTFNVSMGTAPLNNASISAITQTNVTFRWLTIPSDITYRLDIDDDPDFNSPIAGLADLTGSSRVVTLAPGVYHWRVYPASVNPADGVPNKTLFITPGALPRATMGPIAGDNIVNLAESLPELVVSVCNGVTAPAEIPLAATPYTFELATTSAFSSDISSLATLCDGNPTSVIPVALLQQKPFVRLITHYVGGMRMTTPAVRVEVDVVPPSAPALISPAHTARTDQTRPVFTWAASAGIRPVNGYRLEVYAIGEATPLQTVVTGNTTLNTNSLPVSVFAALPAIAIEWRVVAVDTAGNETPSPRSTVYVHPGIAPAHLTYLTDTTPTFTFNKQAGYTGPYTLAVSDNSTLIAPTLVEFACPASGSTCSYTLPDSAALFTYLTYYWLVLPSNTLPSDLFGFTASQLYILPPTDEITVPMLNLPDGDADRLLNNAQVSDGIVFSWSVPGTPVTVQPVAYELQVSRSASFATTVINTVTSDSTPSLTAGSGLSEGIHHWRVRAVLSAGGFTGYSAVGNFTVDRTPPPMVSVTSPAQGSSVSTLRPRIAWNSAATAVGYEGALNGQPFTAPAANFTPAELPQGIHTFTVQARDAAGNLSATTMRTFNVNVSLSPARGTVLRTTTGALPSVNFVWAAPPGYTGMYTLILDTDGDFTTIDTVNGVQIEPVTSLSTNRYTWTGLPEGVYRWRVLLAGEDVAQPALEAFTFAQTRSGFPVAGLSAVAGDDRVNLAEYNSAAFVWTPQNTLLWPPASYTLQIARNNTFTSGLITADLTGVSLDLAPLNLLDGAYFWRVITHYGQGFTSTSVARSLTLDRIAPAIAPALSSPVANLIVGTRTPRFVWGSVPSATSYRLDILDTDETSIVRSLITSATSLTLPSGAALPDSTYFWRVQAFDAAGNASPLSLSRRIRVSVP